MPKSPFWRQTLSRQQTYYRLDLRLLSSRTAKILFSINDMDSGVLSKQHKRGSGTTCSLTGRWALGISAKQSYPWNPTPPSAQAPSCIWALSTSVSPITQGLTTPKNPGKRANGWMPTLANCFPGQAWKPAASPSGRAPKLWGLLRHLWILETNK